MIEANVGRRESGDTYRVRSRTAYWLGRGFAAAAFAVVCALALPTAAGAKWAFCAVGMALFGFFTGYALRQLLRRAPRLDLTRAGFTAADLGRSSIPWTQVVAIESFGSREAPFIAFLVPTADAHRAGLSPWARMMVGMLGRSGMPAFSINLIGVDRDVGEIVGRARALWLASTRPVGPPAAATTRA